MQVIEKLAPLLGELEDQRQLALKKRKKGQKYAWIAAAIWAVIAIIVTANISTPVLPIVASFVGFVITFLIIYSLFIGKFRAEYERAYKSQVLTEVTKSIQPGMRYRPSEGISKAVFKSAGIYKSRIDRYHSEDLFIGDVGDTAVCFSEVKAERKDTSRDSKGNTKTSWHTIFDGVFFMADFHKDFSTWVTVEPDFAEKTFGWLGKKFQKMGGSVVHLESPEFEKAFVVRGGDQVEARYILTPSMQENLLDLRRLHGDSLRLAFKDSKVIMGFTARENWFEPDFFKPSHEVRQIEGFVLEMQACCSIVEMMNLNTRIWTKT